MNRRQFLQAFGVGAWAVSSGALAHALTVLPAGALAPTAQNTDPTAYVINRLTYGVTPDLYSHVQQIGAQAFIEEQLTPDALDTADLDARLTVWMPILNADSGDLFQQFRENRGLVRNALTGSTVVRAMYSPRQLYERMVYFFSNHFYIYIGKDQQGLFLKIEDDREVIRRNAMSNFRQILGASAKSPAMLVYLDNARSHKRAPNENYARELMELHTVGVNGGYTEDDVKAVARAFTGWTLRNRDETDAFDYEFRPDSHDDDEKTILNIVLPAGGGDRDGEQVLDLLASHPSTAEFISTKLARRFVSDTPPETLITRLADTFTVSGGDVQALLRTMLSSEEFWNAPPKLKHPIEYLVSTLRAMAFDMTDEEQFLRFLSNTLGIMGNLPFAWTAPNGYPDVSWYWKDGLINRWNLAIRAASGNIPGGQINTERLVDLFEANGVPLEVEPVLEFMAEYLLGRSLTAEEQGIVMEFARASGDTTEAQMTSGIALLLASPAFQYR